MSLSSRETCRLSDHIVNRDSTNGISYLTCVNNNSRLSHDYYREIYQTRNDVTLDQVQKSLSDRWATQSEGRLHFTLQNYYQSSIWNVRKHFYRFWNQHNCLVNFPRIALCVIHLANLRLNERHIYITANNFKLSF